MSDTPKTDAMEEMLGSWLPPESAPLDGTMILGDFGWPWAIPTVWDTYDEQWSVATVQASLMADGPMNYWLETDTENKTQLKRWMPIPSLSNIAGHPQGREGQHGPE